MHKNWFLITFVALWTLDIIFTLMFVSRFGIESEANPIMRFILEETGKVGFTVFKIVTVAPLIPLHQHMPRWVYIGLTLIMVPIVYMGAVVGLDLYGQ